MSLIKKRIVLKLSGESLKDKRKNNILSTKKLMNLAEQISRLSKMHQICIVVGGGNIWRGGSATTDIFREEQAHYMGMIATIINSIALRECLLKHRVKTQVVSALPIPTVVETYTPALGSRILSKNIVLIVAGGTGQPFFSTDTGAAKDAKELKAAKILMAKNGVDGAYSKDPKKHFFVKRFSRLPFRQAISQKIGVMDLTAMKMCEENNVNILVFNIERKDAIIRALKDEIPNTLITV